VGDLILRADVEGVATLTLNRPKVLNALSPTLFVELREQIDAIAGEEEAIGCVVLRGEGRSFSAGNDLKALQAGEVSPSPDFNAETIEALENLPQPVIASVRGHCFTGALELVLGCDLLICSDTARFADTHGRWGMAPLWGMSQRLPRRVGELAAKDMMWSTRPIGSEEAVRIGLANRSVPDSELDTETAGWAAQIAKSSRFTLRTTKELIAGGRDLPLRDALLYERRESPGAGPDMIERLKDFGK
jgi:enoyl-CoA hydratase/carnithine racemase